MAPGSVGTRLESRMRWLIVLPTLALAGCLGASRPAPDVAQFDFGPTASVPAMTPVFPLRSVDVAAPSWLDSPALQYRLAYAEPARRQSYAESRWVAPPGELLEVALRRAIVSSETSTVTGGCRLLIDLDELAQVFRTPRDSDGVIEVRASLLAARTDTLLARRGFSVSRPAATADARGGVAAITAAVEALAAGVRDWLGALDRERAPGLNIAQTCRGA